MKLLTDLLAEHARLTGRVLPGPMSAADTTRLFEVIGKPGPDTSDAAQAEAESYAYLECFVSEHNED